MKKIFFILLIATGFISSRSSAQLNLNVNIGSQPLWGPVGYDHVDYYYLPDVESYYYVPKKQFVYLDNNKWNFSPSLPSRYSGYNLYNGYKVVINSRDAYQNFNNDKVRYVKYKKVKGQKAIKYSNDSRYYVVKGHPHAVSAGKARKINQVGNGKGNSKAKGNGKGHRGVNGNGKGKK